MNKRFFSVMLVIAFLFTVVSCDYSKKSALFHIYNHSSFSVTEIYVPSRSFETGYRKDLLSNEDCKLFSEWVENDSAYTEIRFIMNENEYGCKERENALADITGRFKPYKLIHDGDTVNVSIYDDHWEWY